MSKNYKFGHYIFPLMLSFLSMNTIAAINVYGPGGPAPAMHEAA
jgi:accessory colonization factor AcfC